MHPAMTHPATTEARGRRLRTTVLRLLCVVAFSAAAAGCPHPQTQPGAKSPGEQEAQEPQQPGPGETPQQGGSHVGERNVAGQFDYYLLTLSWSPQFCATRGKQARPDDPQCGVGVAHGFVVHGLWPQYDPRGWPESCSTTGELDPAIVQRMLPIMPSPRLITHEWQKHGTCSGLTPQEYFSRLESMFAAIKLPPRLQRPAEPIVTTLEDFRRELLTHNPSLPADGSALTVHCQGGFLREVRICYTKAFEPRPCGGRDSCPSGALTVRPLSSGPVGATGPM